MATDSITGTYCPLCFEKLRVRNGTTIHYCEWHDCNFECDISIKDESVNGITAIEGRISVMKKQREQIVNEIKLAQLRLTTLNDRIYLYEKEHNYRILEMPTICRFNFK